MPPRLQSSKQSDLSSQQKINPVFIVSFINENIYYLVDMQLEITCNRLFTEIPWLIAHLNAFHISLHHFFQLTYEFGFLDMCPSCDNTTCLSLPFASTRCLHVANSQKTRKRSCTALLTLFLSSPVSCHHLLCSSGSWRHNSALLAATPSPVVFCHNDVQEGKIVSCYCSRLIIDCLSGLSVRIRLGRAI